MKRSNQFRLGMVVILLTNPTLVALAPSVKAQPIFTPSEQHHVPIIQWEAGPFHGEPEYPYAAGYMDTTWSNPSYFPVEKVRIITYFPNTPDPSVIGANNWLAAGMFLQGQDSNLSGRDYGFYSVLVLDNTGALYLDIGVWADDEWQTWSNLDFKRTWLIGNVARNTPVMLTMYWDPGPTRTIFWYATIDTVDYYPPDNFYDPSVMRPSIIKGFYVGVANPSIGPIEHWCFYFQFGVMSPQAVPAGWQATVCWPKYFKDNTWNEVDSATYVNGGAALLDFIFRWGGGANFPGINVTRHQYGFATFYVDWGDIYYGLDLWNPWDKDRSGACPYVLVWNGQQYLIDNNLLPASEMGNGNDVEDYYKLEQPLVPILTRGSFSLYSLQIREFEHEHDYFDQVGLLAVDHGSNTDIAVTPHGKILTYNNPSPPLSCIDNHGVSQLSETNRMDGNVSAPSTYFQGYSGDYLVLNFGRVNASNAKLIVRDDMKCPDEDTCIKVQVPDVHGDWQTVEDLQPRNYWSIEAASLTMYIPQDGDFTIRLLWTATHRLDYVGLDTTTQGDYTVRNAILTSAIHSIEGNVLPKLVQNDQIYAELMPGQKIELAFLLSNNLKEKRTFVLFTEGHYSTIA